MISSLSIWDGGHECSVHFHSFEKKTLENKIYQASCCVWPVILMLFKAQTKDLKRNWFDFFFIQFFLAKSVNVHYKKKTKEKN